ncbi:MAG: EAL domain-containing protein [Oscillospiraceae bacterium]|nr:EAL domain-containing protein [Oscillospiraceae bacterium]
MSNQSKTSNTIDYVQNISAIKQPSKYKTAAENGGSLLYAAVENSGNLAYSMSFHQGFPAKILAGSCPLGAAGDTIIMGETVHPDDYQPFCEVISQVIAGTANEIKVHARLNNGGVYEWFYITGKVRRGSSLLDFIEGMMFNVTAYLDCEGEDVVMRRYRSKHSVKLNDQSTYTLRDILGEDYLVRIQQPFSQTKGLYSAITDNDGSVISPTGQDKHLNLNKMDYQRKKSIRVRHQTIGSWIITGEDQETVDGNAQLLDTMVHTVSSVANSYVALVDEMETSQNANKLLGQNFEDQILVNGVYSIFLQSPDTKTAIRNITLLITEHFGLSEIEFCTDDMNPVKSYKLDKSGMVLPIMVNFVCKPEIQEELDYSGIVCTDRKTIGQDRDGKNLSCVLARTYDQGTNRGVLLYTAKTSDREWSSRERTLLKSLTQLLSTVIYKLFLEEELHNSRTRLERLAYYDISTNIPNRSMFERDFSDEISENRSGAVLAVEFSNLKNISEIYGFEYSDDILKSCAEYIQALPCSGPKKVYRFSGDILFIMLSGIQREEARQFAQAVLTKFRSPWYLHDNEHHIRVYAGFTIYPHDAESIQSCVNAATHTLRLAKERRFEDAVCYSEGLEENLTDNLMVKKLITDAAESGFTGFYYLYQPVLEMNTGALHCCEASLFWGNEEMTVPRDRFLPIIDQLGLSKQLYRFATDQICHFCARVRELGFPDFRVSFNIPENILNSEVSVEILQSTLLEYSLPPSAVSIAVSEKAGTLNSGSVYLQQLSEMGVNVIADDTGAGYFTAEPLDNPAVKTVKIKASRMSGDSVSSAFVKSLIKLAREKKIAVCAKDIDSPRDLASLSGYDVDLIEGIFNGRPLRDKEFIEKMTEN